MTQDPRRRIEIEGAFNVRDIGGYETADGRMTRWQTFLRADNVSTLPQHSQDTLTSTYRNTNGDRPPSAGTRSTGSRITYSLGHRACGTTTSIS